MQRHPDTGLLGHGDDLFHEVGEVFPDLLLRVGSAFGVGAGKDLGLVAERAVAAACVLADPVVGAQDAVGLPCNGGEGDLLLAQHPEHVVEPLDLEIAVGQVEVDALIFLQLIAGRIRNGHAEAGQLFLLLLQDFPVDLIGLEHQADVFHAHLTDEGERGIALAGADGDLGTQRHKIDLFSFGSFSEKPPDGSGRRAVRVISRKWGRRSLH